MLIFRFYYKELKQILYNALLYFPCVCVQLNEKQIIKKKLSSRIVS